MEKEKLFLSEENTMLPTWNSSSSFGMEIQSNHLNCSSEQLPNCFFNPNWENNSMEQTDTFGSALSSMVSSCSRKRRRRRRCCAQRTHRQTRKHLQLRRRRGRNVAATLHWCQQQQ
ncbi:hypothetical protein LOK49_LG08G02172 [Camellia lanceoleosa]|uniref:Uncharacterized protein n=1 Tax=Camellia lanceoleosa TaxID=1840588 RepID=A0ACC0GVU9_9ERIC|nr:hypothetical protein LOK49_LG08G02172 [Camellia lanceoleosa]